MWEQIFDILKEPVAALLTLGVIAVISLVCAKLGIDLKWIKEARLSEKVRQAILMAEEWAARRYQLGDKTITGERKLQFVKDILPDVPKAKIEEIVDQELFGLGLGAAKDLQKTKELLKEGKLSLTGSSKE